MEPKSETQNTTSQISGLQDLALPVSFNFPQFASMQQNANGSAIPDVQADIAIARQNIALRLNTISWIQTLNNMMVNNNVINNSTHIPQETSSSGGASSPAYVATVGEIKNEEQCSANVSEIPEVTDGCLPNLTNMMSQLTVPEKLQTTDSCPPNLTNIMSQLTAPQKLQTIDSCPPNLTNVVSQATALSPAPQASQNVENNQPAVSNTALAYYCDPNTIQQYPVNWSQQLRAVPSEYLTHPYIYAYSSQRQTQPYKLPTVENIQTTTVSNAIPSMPTISIPARGVSCDGTIQSVPNVVSHTACDNEQIVRMLTDMKVILQNYDNQMMSLLSTFHQSCSTLHQSYSKMVEQMSNIIAVLQREQQQQTVLNNTQSATNLPVVATNSTPGAVQYSPFPPPPPGLNFYNMFPETRGRGRLARD